VPEDGRVSDEAPATGRSGDDDEPHADDASPALDRGGPRLTRAQAFAFRVSDRLNAITKLYLGPAQVGRERRATEVRPLTTSPCPLCGQPMSAHDLVHSDTGRQRFYCPTSATGDP
jgi:hypothetical protein